ncbi:hypothetical protein N9A94_05420 [Akkermansiaceae bacterium]|nr:hypothetical protein [Akkermansiaceae bacterium]MDB4544627.1 hypothetical protein [Akkermansiaceae bacterium]
MIYLRLGSLLCLLLFLTPANAQDEIEETVANLASESFEKRKEATRKLWEAGQDAVQALTVAAKSDDPELADRAGFVLRRIKLQLTPETSSEVLSLIDGFPALGPDARLKALGELSKIEEASFAFLKLWAEEKDFGVKDALAKQASKALEASLKSVVDIADYDGAEQLLAQFPENPQTSRRYAEIYHLTGRIAAKIQDLELAEGRNERLLLLACYRRIGAFEKAFALAQELNEKSAIASLSLLSGNWEPYLSWHEGQGGNSVPIKTTYQIIRAQMENRPDDALALAKELLQEVDKTRSSYDRNRIFRNLHLTGYVDLTRKLMKKHNSSILPNLHSLTLNTDGYLGQYGYPETEEARKEWQQQRVRKIIASGNYETQEAREIFYLASRYHTLGDLEMSRKLIAPLEEASRKAGEEHWQKFLEGLLYSSRYPLLLETIEDDWVEKDYLGLLEGFYAGIKDDKTALWNHLTKEKDLSLRQYFDEMAIFYDWSSPGQEERAEVWTRMVERGRKNEELLDLIIRNGLEREPLMFMKEAMLARADRFERLTSKQQWDTVRLFIHLRDWDQALVFLRQMEKPENDQPGLVAGVLKKSGREAEGNAVLERAHSKAVANPQELASMADQLIITGCLHEATQLRRRIAMELPPTSPVWQGNFLWMLEDAESKNDRGKARATSLAFVLSLVNGSSWSSSTDPLSANLRLKLYCGLDLIDAGDPAGGHAMIEKAVEPLIGSYYITNTVLEHLERSDYPELYEKIFQSSYQRMKSAVEKFPRYTKALNGVAWLCAVAECKHEEARKHSMASIENYPSAAYYDTLARIHRNLGNRNEEIHWQEFAVKHSRNTGFSNNPSVLSRYDWILENPR